MAVQNEVGHADWGMYSGVMSFAFLFIALSDLGVNQYTTQKLASEQDRLRELYPSLFSVKLILLIVYPILLLAAGWLWGYNERELYFLLLLCMLNGASQLTQFFRANFQAQQRFKLDSLASVLDRAILLLLVGALFYFGVDIQRFIYSRFLAMVLTMLVFLLVSIKLYGWIRPKIDLKKLREVMKFSLPFALVTVLYSVHDKVDQVMLEKLAGEVPTGLYAAAYRIVDVFSMYLWTVLAIFFARFAFFINDRGEKQKILDFGQVITTLPMAFICIFMQFYGDKLFFLLKDSTGEEMTTMVNCLSVLFAAVFVNSTFIIHGTLLTSTGHIQFVNKAVAVGIFLNIVMNLIFIPTYGAIAAAWSTLASFTLLGITYLFYNQFILKMQVPWKNILRIYLISGATYGIFYGLTYWVAPWYVNTFIAGIGYAGLSLVGGVLNVKELRSWITSK